MRFVFILTIFLTGCTFAVHDPVKFEENAEHISKTYAADRDDLYTCFINHYSGSPTGLTYQTKQFYTYEDKGFIKVTFSEPKAGKTIVRASATRGGNWLVKPQKILEFTDRCAGMKG